MRTRHIRMDGLWDDTGVPVVYVAHPVILTKAGIHALLN